MEPEKQNDTNENMETPAEESAEMSPPEQNVGEQQSPFTPSPEPEMTPEPPKSSSLGPVVGIIIIIILIILAGFYFWGSSLKQDMGAVMEEDASDTAGGGAMMESTTEVGEPLSESDEVADLEVELGSTDLDNLDAELSDIDAELNF